MEYQLIRSRRKSIGIEVRKDGQVLVRAPLFLSDRQIRKFVDAHETWILKHKEIVKKRKEEQDAQPAYTEEELRQLKKKAAFYIPERVAFYAPLIGVTYGRVTIRAQKTRWGSCSTKGNLNFNCLLMLTPPEVIDSVVVHELCHRKEMNHSKRFYEEVTNVFPEYKKWQKWLKENGSALLGRLS